MSIPTAYTEAELAQFMADEIGAAVASVLGWTVPGSYERIVWRAMRMLGVTSLSGETDMAMVEAAARYAVWMAVASQSAAFVDVNTDGQSLALSQAHVNPREMMVTARWDAIRAGVIGAAYTVEMETIGWVDPYGAIERDEMES